MYIAVLLFTCIGYYWGSDMQALSHIFIVLAKILFSIDSFET